MLPRGLEKLLLDIIGDFSFVYGKKTTVLLQFLLVELAELGGFGLLGVFFERLLPCKYG